MYTLVFQYSWYFFEALVKSMAQYLMESGKVKVNIIICYTQNYSSNSGTVKTWYLPAMEINQNWKYSESYLDFWKTSHIKVLL